MHVHRTEVPIIVVLKAMGVESDQEAITLVGPEPGLAALLAPSLEEAASTLEIYSQMQALEYLCEHRFLPSLSCQLSCCSSLMHVVVIVTTADESSSSVHLRARTRTQTHSSMHTHTYTCTRTHAHTLTHTDHSLCRSEEAKAAGHDEQWSS